MSHWSFLIERLGKDVVNYGIAPFLLPPTQDRAVLKACLWDLKVLFEIMRIKFHRALKVKLAIKCLHSNTREDECVTTEARGIINRKIHGLFDRTYSKLDIKGICRGELERRWMNANYPSLTVEWIANIVTRREVCYTYQDLRPSRIQHERDSDSDSKMSECIHCLAKYSRFITQSSYMSHQRKQAEIGLRRNLIGRMMREVKQRLSRKP